MMDDRDFAALVDDVIRRGYRRVEQWRKSSRKYNPPCLEGLLRRVDVAVQERKAARVTSSREDEEFYGLLAHAARRALSHDETQLDDELDTIELEARERERLAFIASITEREAAVC